MQGSYQAYSGGVSIRDYVDMRFGNQAEQLERIGDTLERIELRVGVVEKFQYKLIGAVGVAVLVGNYVAEKYL